MSNTQPTTVLVVEDSPVQRRVLQRRLESQGFTVITAADGDEALGVAAREPFAAVISDIHMEPVGGFELCRRLRANPTFDGMVIVLTSASDPDGTNARLAADSGADAYAERTSDLQAVFAALAAALGVRTLSDGQS